MERSCLELPPERGVGAEQINRLLGGYCQDKKVLSPNYSSDCRGGPRCAKKSSMKCASSPGEIRSVQSKKALSEAN